MLKTFDETIVYFTPTSTTINDKTGAKSSLKVQVVPTSNKTNIDTIKISYTNDLLKINEEVDDVNIFTSLVYSMRGDSDTLVEKGAEYMNSLQQDEVAVIIREYSKYIKDGIVFDALIAGIGSYIALFTLMENGAFIGQLPFEFGVPWTVASGNVLNSNMFRYMLLPLASLRKVSQGVLLQLVLFVESFINIWSPLFLPGPEIGTSIEMRGCVEIISGFSQHILTMGDSLKEYVIQNSDSGLRELLQESSSKILELSYKLDEATNKINDLSQQLEAVKLSLVIEPERNASISVNDKKVVRWERK